jgi:excisionase family DNA binding protein
MTCPLCNIPIRWQHGWPACQCDSDRTLKLTVRQAAQLLHTSPGGVYHLISDGYLRADKSTRPIRIAMITLKAYLAAGHAEHTHRQQLRQAGRP